MSYLLDTHTLLWSLFEKKKIPPTVQALLRDPDQCIYVSSISLWEIALKFRLGKLEFQHFNPSDLPAICEQMQFDLLPLDPEEASSYHLLRSEFHKDPFDRMLVWQAIQNDLVLLSSDLLVHQYVVEGLQVKWD
ncbi:MAG: type II toxin-antitoxin system VapC family toxin [Lewinellaceae bacterium]|nr:type II toxin-antitoxin system VapC family toxin [Lewinellaceae bacterium]